MSILVRNAEFALIPCWSNNKMPVIYKYHHLIGLNTVTQLQLLSLHLQSSDKETGKLGIPCTENTCGSDAHHA